jgi:hypothetical protein
MWGPVILGLTQDGTSNGSLVALVDRLVAAALVLAVGIFVVQVLAPSKQRGTGRFEAGGGRNSTHPSPRRAVETTVRFALFVFLVTGVWGLVRLSGWVAAGLLGGG